MTLFSSLRVALDALLVHKGRSTLTSLGIVIGIGAVIAMVSAGDGARSLLEDRLESVGKNIILVQPGSHTPQGTPANFAPLTSEDANAIARRVGPLLVGVSPTQVLQRQVFTSAVQTTTPIVGCTPELQPVRNWKMTSGRFLNADDLKKRAPVCLLAQHVVERLFPHRDPVGQAVRVGHLELRVVGVLAPKGRSPTGGDQDDQIMVPLSTLQHGLAGDERLTMIVTAARSEDLVARAKKEIEGVLRERHHVKPGAENFQVDSVHEMASLAEVVTETLQILVAVIAGLSLLVGGIGIMNIMLVSVTERTREIGIRMAVGASPAAVLVQFLLEAVVLSLAGGLLGITLGLAVAVVLAHFIGWPVVVSPWAVLVACGVSGAVGVFFGYYPAWRASRLDPIEALRHE